MPKLTRRELLGTAIAGGISYGVHTATRGKLLAQSANSEVRLGLIGLGGIDIEGSVGGRGRQLIDALKKVPGQRIVALCDVDKDVLDHGVKYLRKDHTGPVAAHEDMRKVFEDDNVDAVLIATPNHWHALATVWACQAGKDVYVEKPFSHTIWEGRQMVAAARKHERVVQVGTQNRSRLALSDAFEYLHSGELGAIKSVHAIVYRPRDGIGTVDGHTPVPQSVNYDLWCGPIAKHPIMRKHLHYEWHWFWETGNGEIGNNGPHTIDVARWALGQDAAPPRAISIGGRFGPPDAAETPNTQIAFYDYKPAPLICEVRNVGRGKGPEAIGKFRDTARGIYVDCEGGHGVEAGEGFALFDRDGKQIREFQRDQDRRDLPSDHLANFIAAVRSRKSGELRAEAVEGHLSAACCHMANVSHRLGTALPPEAIAAQVQDDPLLADAFDRCREHLELNGIDLSKSKAVLGPWLALDPKTETFVGEFSDQANSLSHKKYRDGFEVPELV